MASFLEQLMTQNFWVQLLSAYHFSILVTAKKRRKEKSVSYQTPNHFSPLSKSVSLSQKNTVEITNELFICCSGSATTAMTCDGIYLCKAWLLCCTRLKTTYSPAYRLSQTTDHPDKIFFFFISFLPSPSPLFFWFTVLCCLMNNTLPSSHKARKIQLGL